MKKIIERYKQIYDKDRPLDESDLERFTDGINFLIGWVVLGAVLVIFYFWIFGE